MSAGPGTAGKAQGSLRRGGLGFWGWGSAGNAGNGPGALTSRRWEGMGRRPDLPAPPGSHTLARASDGGGIITPRGELRTSWDLLELGDGDTSPYVASVPHRTERAESKDCQDWEVPSLACSSILLLRDRKPHLENERSSAVTASRDPVPSVFSHGSLASLPRDLSS